MEGKRNSKAGIKQAGKRKASEENNLAKNRLKQDEQAWKEAERLSKKQAEKEQAEAERRAKEQKKAREKAEKKAKEEAKRQKKEEERRARLEARERQKLVKRCGVQQPGKYLIKVESQNKELVERIEVSLNEIPGLQINYSGGSQEGIVYGVEMEQPTELLLILSDLPYVADAKFDNKRIRVAVQPG